MVLEVFDLILSKIELEILSNFVGFLNGNIVVIEKFLYEIEKDF